MSERSGGPPGSGGESAAGHDNTGAGAAGADRSGVDEAYAYKPSLRGAAWHYTLGPEALGWSRGRYAGEVRYRDITRLRLSYRPMTMQMARFQLDIWAPQAPRLVVMSATCRSFVEMVSQADAYRGFVTALHRRVAEAGGTPRCESGIAPALYVIGVVVLGGTALALVALALRAVSVGAWGGAAFLAAFLAVFGWQVGTYFRRNRPGRYELTALPERLLPRGEKTPQSRTTSTEHVA